MNADAEELIRHGAGAELLALILFQTHKYRKKNSLDDFIKNQPFYMKCPKELV